MWQDLQNHIIERIHSKGFYIFDHKDGDPNAYLVPHNVEHFIYQGDFLKNLFEKIMVKLAIIYDLDNTVTQEIEDEKVKAVATLYDGLREHRTASHSEKAPLKPKKRVAGRIPKGLQRPRIRAAMAK